LLYTYLKLRLVGDISCLRWMVLA